MAQWALEHVVQDVNGWFTLQDAYDNFKSTACSKLGKIHFNKRLQQRLSGAFNDRKKIGGDVKRCVYAGVSLV